MMPSRRGTNLAKLNLMPATDSSMHVQSQITVHIKLLDVLPKVFRFLHCYPHRPPPFPIPTALFLEFA